MDVGQEEGAFRGRREKRRGKKARRERISRRKGLIVGGGNRAVR